MVNCPGNNDHAMFPMFFFPAYICRFFNVFLHHFSKITNYVKITNYSWLSSYAMAIQVDLGKV